MVLNGKKFNKIMKAHEVKYGTKVIVVSDVSTPPASIPIKIGDVITIHNLDGIYCNGENENGEKIYLSAWTDVNECD